MNRLKRVLLFLLMVASGLTVAMLLAERDVRTRGHGIRTVEGTKSNPDAIVVEDKAQPDESLQVNFPDEVEFDIMRRVEIEPGVFEERVAYTIHMMSGQQEGGDFLATSPTVTFRDELTGEVAGTLSADQARFAMSRQVGGRVTIDPSQISPDRFVVTGNVRGQFPLKDGIPVNLEAESMTVDGQIVTGPGRVTWTREDMRLEGNDFRWDNETGRLNYVTDAMIAVEPTPEHLGFDLFAPGGLTWNFPPDSDDPVLESWGELRGRVSGLATDGSRMGADRVYVHSTTVTLSGDSVYELEADDGGLYRVTATRITVQPNDVGVLSFAEADGNVHIMTAPIAVVPAWMVTDHITMIGDDVVAPGDATVRIDDMVTNGTSARFNRAIGKYEYDRDVVIDVDADSPRSVAGLHLTAPGGMTLVVPPEVVAPAEAITGDLRGGVVGTLPDGTQFESNVLYIDGPNHAYTLDGDAHFQLQNEAEEVTEVDARQIRFETSGDGKLALMSAVGDVIIVSTPVDMIPTRIVTGRLDVTETTAFSPDEVVWTRDNITVVGTGMWWRDDEGRLDLERNAVLTIFDAQRDLESELSGAGGLTWWLPDTNMMSFAEGHGELLGPVVGRSSDGSSLETEMLYVDGRTSRLTLLGPSMVDYRGGEVPLTVMSDEFIVDGFDQENTKVSSSLPVEWIRPDMTGSGTGLAWDQASGVLELDRDVKLEFRPDSDSSVQITADGKLTWNQPPGDPTGWGEIREKVEGRISDGSQFATDTLRIDGRTRQVHMRGASRYQRAVDDTSIYLEASNSIDLEVGDDGDVRWIEAQGDVDGFFSSTATDSALGPITSRVLGDRLVIDRLYNEATVYGPDCHYVHDEPGRHATLDAAESIHVRTNAEDGIEWIEALEDVVAQTNRFEGRGQRFVWNVPEDHATLYAAPGGICHLVQGGATLNAQQVEFWPESGQFRVTHPTLRASKADK